VKKIMPRPNSLDMNETANRNSNFYNPIYIIKSKKISQLPAKEPLARKQQPLFFLPKTSLSRSPDGGKNHDGY